MKNAKNKILSAFRKWKSRKHILLAKMKKNIDKVIVIQKWIRGKIIRKRYFMQIQEARWNAIKKSKKWIYITKLQAHIRGFLLRVRKKRGLEKVRDGLDDAEDELDDLIDFFGNDKRAKGENFDKEIAMPDINGDEMKGMFDMFQKKPSNNLPPLSKKPVLSKIANIDKPPVTRHFSTDSAPDATARSNGSSRHLSEINRKMLSNNNQYMNGAPNNHFFHGPGAKRERSPTSVSGAITEIDLNSDKHAIGGESGTSFYNANQPVVNNLMNQSRASFTGSNATLKKTKVSQQKREYVDSWGFQNEQSKKLIEARYLKLNKLKNKKKKLTSDDRIKMFRKQSKKLN